ncbi:MAG TPA: hypothetical protein V6D28_05605 [Leptolyngbyaceae cyanobacterium]
MSPKWQQQIEREPIDEKHGISHRRIKPSSVFVLVGSPNYRKA